MRPVHFPTTPAELLALLAAIAVKLMHDSRF